MKTPEKIDDMAPRTFAAITAPGGDLMLRMNRGDTELVSQLSDGQAWIMLESLVRHLRVGRPADGGR